MKKLLMIGILASNFLLAENISPERLERICNSKGYLKKYGTYESCLSVFKERSDKEAKDIQVLNKSSNTSTLVSNYIRYHGKQDSKNEAFILESNTMPYFKVDLSKQNRDFDYALRKSYSLFLTQPYDFENNPYTKVDKSTGNIVKINTNLDLKKIVSNYKKISYQDKENVYKLILLINDRERNYKEGNVKIHEIMLTEYFKIFDKIKKENYFPSKLRHSYLESFTRLNNNKLKEMSILFLNKKLKSEKDQYSRLKIIIILKKLGYSGNFDYVKERKAFYNEIKRNYRKSDLNISEKILLISEFYRIERGL